MAESIFKEKFGNIKKIKVCTTTADLNFDTYTEPGTYEIYEDMGSGQSRIYLLTVDKSVSGACLKQTRIHCGIVDARQTNASGVWTEWAAISGGSIDLSEYATKQYVDAQDNNLFDQVGSVQQQANLLEANLSGVRMQIE